MTVNNKSAYDMIGGKYHSVIIYQTSIGIISFSFEKILEATLTTILK